MFSVHHHLVGVGSHHVHLDRTLLLVSRTGAYKLLGGGQCVREGGQVAGGGRTLQELSIGGGQDLWGLSWGGGQINAP